MQAAQHVWMPWALQSFEMQILLVKLRSGSGWLPDVSLIPAWFTVLCFGSKSYLTEKVRMISNGGSGRHDGGNGPNETLAVVAEGELLITCEVRVTNITTEIVKRDKIEKRNVR